MYYTAFTTTLCIGLIIRYIDHLHDTVSYLLHEPTTRYLWFVNVLSLFVIDTKNINMW